MEYTIVINGQFYPITLTNEQLQGIIDAWNDLDRKLNLRIYFPRGELHPVFDTFLPDRHLLIHGGEFFGTSKYIFCQNKPWIECVKSRMDFPNTEFKRYTFVFLDKPIPGPMQSPIIVNEQTLSNEFFIRHFDTSAYLEAYLEVFKWFGIPWQNHIKLLHEGNTPITF